MALTEEQLENAEKGVQFIDDVATKMGTATNRLGNEYKTLPQVIADAEVALSEQNIGEGAAALINQRIDKFAGEPLGGWYGVVIDSDQRIIAGYHALVGHFNTDVADLETRLAAIEDILPDVETTDRIGNWIEVEVDGDGRVVTGKHVLFGDYPIDNTDDASDLDLARILAIAQLRHLRYRDIAPLHPSPPKVTRRSGDGWLIPENAADIITGLDPRLTAVHAPMVEQGGYVRGRWITYDTSQPKGAQVWARRFITDSSRFEFSVYPGNLVALYVDGMPLSIAGTVSIPNTGDTFVVSVDFGDDTQTIHPAQQLIAAGAGYTVGDELAISGGAGATMRVRVTAVDQNGAIQAEGWSVTSWGALTALNANAVAAVGGTGNGAQFKLTNDLFGVPQTGHTTRRMRRIEIVFGGGNGMMGPLRVRKNASVRPWAVSGPRLMIVQDSWGQVFSEHPRGAWAMRLAERLGIEDVWPNTVGGTGYYAGGAPYGTRLSDITTNLPADNRPVILLVQGSINDRGAPSDAAVQEAALTFWRSAFVQLPQTTVMMHVEMMRAAYDTNNQSRADAATNGFKAACAEFDPDGKRSGIIRTRPPVEMMTAGGHAGDASGAGATSAWLSGDGAHLTQAGHDFIGDGLAPEVIRVISTLKI